MIIINRVYNCDCSFVVLNLSNENDRRIRRRSDEIYDIFIEIFKSFCVDKQPITKEIRVCLFLKKFNYTFTFQ